MGASLEKSLEQTQSGGRGMAKVYRRNAGEGRCSGEETGPIGGGRWAEYADRRQNLSAAGWGGCLTVCVVIVLEKETEGKKGRLHSGALHWGEKQGGQRCVAGTLPPETGALPVSFGSTLTSAQLIISLFQLHGNQWHRELCFRAEYPGDTAENQGPWT